MNHNGHGKQEEQTVKKPRSIASSRFIKFCLVGCSGVLVDTMVLYVLTEPAYFGLNVSFGKVCAAEVAMMNNFVWNDCWTFRVIGVSAVQSTSKGAANYGSQSPRNTKWAVITRFLTFNAICGIGIGIAVLMLHVWHTWFGWNLYLSNMLAIVLSALWNYYMSARFGWHVDRRSSSIAEPFIEGN